jgi:hypothetical protein
MWRTSRMLCCTTWSLVSSAAVGLTHGYIPAAEECVYSVDVVDYLDRLHGRV